jgi:hypothetical protein
MIMPSKYDRALSTRQAIALNPNDDPSPSRHLDPPLSLSLALTLGSPVQSRIHVGADTVVKHP